MEAVLKIADERLLEQARQDNSEASAASEAMSELITRYVNIIVIKANKLVRASSSLNKQDAEDFISEGFLALLSAIRTYNEQKGAFSVYANACIDNRMKNALGKARRTLILTEEFDPALIKERVPGADDVVIEKEAREEILKKLGKILSDKEYKVFEMYLDSYSYRQISLRLGVSEKSVDNALSRARSKLKAVHK